MRILVTGASGLLGKDLIAVGAREGHTMIPSAHRQQPGYVPLDVCSYDNCCRVLEAHPVDWVIHAAAKTNVDQCELEPDAAYLVNATAAENMARACAAFAVSIAAISTDYVFGAGGEGPFDETARPSPLNTYGASKLQGEQRVQAAHDRSVIVRTAWLYGAHGRSFPLAVIQGARAHGSVTAVYDQIGTPSFAEDTAQSVFRIINAGFTGICHAAGQGWTSRSDLAQATLDLAGIAVPVHAVSTEEYRAIRPLPAERPRMTALITRGLPNVGSVCDRPWRESLQQFVHHVLKIEATHHDD